MWLWKDVKLKAEREGRSFQTEGIVCQLHRDITDHACQNTIEKCGVPGLGEKKLRKAGWHPFGKSLLCTLSF